MNPHAATKKSKLGNGPEIYLETTTSKTPMERMTVRSIGNNIDEHTTVNLLYPTANTTTNRFVLLATNDDDDDKTILIHNRTNK